MKKNEKHSEIWNDSVLYWLNTGRGQEMRRGFNHNRFGE